MIALLNRIMLTLRLRCVYDNTLSPTAAILWLSALRLASGANVGVIECILVTAAVGAHVYERIAKLQALDVLPTLGSQVALIEKIVQRQAAIEDLVVDVRKKLSIQDAPPIRLQN